jgi:ornithine carbamoyltransferase
MHQLGGHALVLPMADIQLSRGESVWPIPRECCPLF